MILKIVSGMIMMKVEKTEVEMMMEAEMMVGMMVEVEVEMMIEMMVDIKMVVDVEMIVGMLIQWWFRQGKS